MKFLEGDEVLCRQVGAKFYNKVCFVGKHRELGKHPQRQWSDQIFSLVQLNYGQESDLVTEDSLIMVNQAPRFAPDNLRPPEDTTLGIGKIIPAPEDEWLNFDILNKDTQEYYKDNCRLYMGELLEVLGYDQKYGYLLKYLGTSQGNRYGYYSPPIGSLVFVEKKSAESFEKRYLTNRIEKVRRATVIEDMTSSKRKEEAQ